MARRLAGHRGGIAGLLEELDEHAEAIEYDLLTLGFRLEDLGTPALSWRDLLVIMRHLPRTSAYARAKFGTDAAWGLTEHLLATAVDVLQTANWQRGGKKAGPKPKPVPRPGKTKKTRRIGRDPIPVKDFNAWWDSGGR